MLCKMMLYLFGFDIQDILQFLGVAFSGCCLLFTYKTFKQAENINRIQEERRRDEEAKYQLECIVSKLKERCFDVVFQCALTQKWLQETKPYNGIQKLYEETKNKQDEFLKSGFDGMFNKIMKDYDLQEDEKEFLRTICNDYVFTKQEFNLELLIRDNLNNKLDNGILSKQTESFINTVFARQICKVLNFNYEMIDKIYSKVVFSKNYDQKTN